MIFITDFFLFICMLVSTCNKSDEFASYNKGLRSVNKLVCAGLGDQLICIKNFN